MEVSSPAPHAIDGASNDGSRVASRQSARRSSYVDLDGLIDAVLHRASPDELLSCVADALAPLGVIGGALIVADRDGAPSTMSTTGISADIECRLGATVVDGRFPVMAALRLARPLWLRDDESVAARFPVFAAIPSTWKAYAAVPLRVEGHLVGSLALPFDTPQSFGSVTRISVLSAAALLARGVHHSARHGHTPMPHHTSVFDRMHDGVIVVDRESGRIVQANASALEIGGLQRDEVVGRSVDDIVALLRPQVVAAPRPLDDGCTVAPSVITRRDGTRRTIESYYSLDESTSLLTIVITDVTDGDAHASPSFLQAQEVLFSERSRVARDLHDGVVQSVFAISLSLASLALRSPEPARSLIEQSIDGLDAIVRQVRSTVFDLRRRQVDVASARVAHEMSAAEQALGFAPVVHVDPRIDELCAGEQVGRELADHLLLALREAISNVARHARASSVWVDVRLLDGALCFTVTDDGIGIDPHAPHGDGLANLHQRAASLGGDCSIQCSLQGGTTVTWSVPIGNDLTHDHDVAC